MRAINHAIAGAAIGISIQNPAVAIGVALLSHFVLDAMPHHDDVRMHQRKLFNIVLMIDALLCLALVLVLFSVRPEDWLRPSIAAFAATSPDFMWFSAWRKGVDAKKELHNWLLQFHSKIQWSQTPGGIIVEVLWFMSGAFILLKIV